MGERDLVVVEEVNRLSRLVVERQTVDVCQAICPLQEQNEAMQYEG